ncbi:MAG: hypothetical protein DRI93_03265 [Aquificota bacterium]|nr:MAG: hypothetical protein DRJ03_14770 [Chloroflexota bacterium]RLD94926.1 MAG: hypothetical protein DRI93_03265 [Aquificota bacterium]
MAVKEPFMVKTVIGNTDLELAADSGESLLIKDVQIYNPSSNYVTLTIDKVTVGYFRVGGVLGSHLPFLNARSQHSHDWKTSSTAEGDQTSFAGLVDAGGNEVAAKMIGGLSKDTTYRRVAQLAKSPMQGMKTILGLLWEKGIFKGYPVATGQTFKISGAKQSGAIQLVIYEVHDEEDITPDMQNGTEATEYVFLNYGNCGANVNKDGDTLYNTPKSPAQFPDFPFGKVVDPKKEITIFGVCASDFAPKENDGTNYCYTKYLKFIRGRKTLFDEDLNGLLLYAPFATALGNMDMVGEGQSIIGNYSDVDMKEPLFFPTPLVYGPGEELNIYLTTVKGGNGQNISTLEHEIALIERVKLLE